jgi:hypothetical protein
VPELRRAPQLERRSIRLPVVRLRAAGDAEPPDGDTLVLDGRACRCTSLPGRWNLANAALAVTAARDTFRRRSP